MANQQFCLRWNNHQSNLLTVFKDLFTSEKYVDVTLVCDGYKARAHKLVLSACSPFFQDIFDSNPCKHPVIVLKDMNHFELSSLLEFMYRGEVSISQEKLGSLLKSAEILKIKGLTEVSSEQKVNGDDESFNEDGNIVGNDEMSCHSPSSPRKRKKRKRSGNCMNQTHQNIDDGGNENSVTGSPGPYHQNDQNEVLNSSLNSTRSQVNVIQNTISLEATGQENLLESHEIKKSFSPPPSEASNNPEYVLDPTNFMEQSLTMDQADKDRAIEATERLFSLPSGSSRESNPNILYTSLSKESNSDQPQISPNNNLSGIGIQIEGAEERNNLYVAPGTSGNIIPVTAASITAGHKPSGNKGNATWHEYTECFICKKSFSSRHYLKTHFELIHSDQRQRKKFNCEVCNKEYLWRHKLLTHMKTVHGIESSPVLAKIECKICHTFFVSKAQLARHHVETHKMLIL